MANPIVSSRSGGITTSLKGVRERIATTPMDLRSQYADYSTGRPLQTAMAPLGKSMDNLTPGPRISERTGSQQT